MKPIKAILFTSATCQPCGVVKDFLSGFDEEDYIVKVISAESLDQQFVDFKIKSVPTLVDLDSQEQFKGPEAIIAHLKSKGK